MKKLNLLGILFLTLFVFTSCSKEEIDIEREAKITATLKDQLFKVANNVSSDTTNLLDLINPNCDCLLLIITNANDQTFLVSSSQYSNFASSTLASFNLTEQDVYLAGIIYENAGSSVTLFSGANMEDYLLDCTLDGTLDTSDNWWSNDYTITDLLNSLGNNVVTFAIGGSPNTSGSNIITINAQDGITAIQTQLDAYNTANGTSFTIDDLILINTIINEDDTDIIIQDEDTIITIIEGGEIELVNYNCLDFVYPFTFIVYNPSTDTNSNVTVANDSDLINLYSNNSVQIVDIQYPISLTGANNETLVINNATELENAFSNSNNYCD